MWAERRAEIQLERELPLLPGVDKQCGAGRGSGGSESEGPYNGLDSNGQKLGTELALLSRSHRTVSLLRGYSQRRQNHCLLRRGSPVLALRNDIPRRAVPLLTPRFFLSLSNDSLSVVKTSCAFIIMTLETCLSSLQFKGINDLPRLGHHRLFFFFFK